MWLPAHLVYYIVPQRTVCFKGGKNLVWFTLGRKTWVRLTSTGHLLLAGRP